MCDCLFAVPAVDFAACFSIWYLESHRMFSRFETQHGPLNPLLVAQAEMPFERSCFSWSGSSRAHDAQRRRAPFWSCLRTPQRMPGLRTAWSTCLHEHLLLHLRCVSKGPNHVSAVALGKVDLGFTSHTTAQQLIKVKKLSVRAYHCTSVFTFPASKSLEWLIDL